MLKRRLLVKMMKRKRRSLMTEKLKKRRNTVFLPEDLLVEILSRVPEASLARFRSTSKGWNALIKNDGRLDKNSLFVMVIYHKVYLVRLNLHGIQDDNVGKGKPVELPKPLSFGYGYGGYALGKSSCNNEYKILRVYRLGYGYGESCLVKYEIYDSISNSWSVVGENRDWFIPWAWINGTSVDGNTYWLVWFTYPPTGMRKAALQCFDFSTERFERVSLPSDTLSYDVIALSVTREEKNLCILTSSRNKKVHDIDVWMATKIRGTGDMSWSKLLTVKRTYSQQFLAFRDGMSFMVDRENKVLVHPTKYKNSSNCLHIVGENYKHIKVDLHDVGYTPFRYYPILVQIQQGSSGLGTWKS